jgi:ubiquinone/menaquinone biosynthesis C-methylase UbiE
VSALPTAFDRWAAGYDESVLQRLLFNPAHRMVLQRCAAAVVGPRLVVDVGCGTGQLLHAAAVQWPGAALVGVDASPAMVATAQRRLAGAPRLLGRVSFVCARAEALPVASRSADLVVATLSYRHWSDRRAGLAEIRRILAPGGVLSLATTLGAPARRWRRRRPTPVLGVLRSCGWEVRDHVVVAMSGPIPDVTVLEAVPAR